MKIFFTKKYIWIYVYLYLIFQTTIQNTTQGIINKIVTYSDDLICLILLFCLIIRSLRKRTVVEGKGELFAIVFYTLYLSIGVFCGSMHDYQKIRYILLDMFTCSKFIIVYFASKVLSEKYIDDDFLFSLNKGLELMAVVLFVLTLHDLLFTPFFEKSEYRYFTNSIKLFFYHPEALARACAGVIYPLAYNMKKKKENIIYILMLCFVMFFTFRMKSVAAMVIFLLLYIYRKYISGKNIALLFAVAVLICLVIGRGQMKFYFSMPEIGRTKLVTDSVTLANEHFPLGTGFGSFGSNAALEHNSLLYENMGYYDKNNKWAVKEYLNDAFWPIVVAQTGWIGTVFFCLAILCLLLKGVKLYKTEFFSGWVILMVLLYDLVSTLGSSAFYHPMSLSGYMFAGIVTSQYLNTKRSVKEK